MEYVGSYTFNSGRGMIDIKGGPSFFSFVVFRASPFSRKEIRGRDKEKLAIRSLKILRELLGEPLRLIDSETSGERFPIPVITEEEEIQEFAEDFLQTPGFFKLISDSKEAEETSDDWKRDDSC